MKTVWKERTEIGLLSLNGKTLQLLSGKSKADIIGLPIIGEGGEGYIIDINSLLSGSVLKLFKQPKDYTGKTAQSTRDGIKAAERLKEYAKKLPLFPKLSDGFIAPKLLAIDLKENCIGYVMDRADIRCSFEQLLSREERRRLGYGFSNVKKILSGLFDLFCELHATGGVIGDVKPANIIIGKDQVVRILDCDSIQFAEFACKGFTAEYVDPRLLDKAQSSLVVTGSFDTQSDWYSFAVIAHTILTGLGPYAGIYELEGQEISEETRILKGITIFDPNVKLPKFAISSETLSPALFDYFKKVFIDGAREPFPIEDLLAIEILTCPVCLTYSAEEFCPKCDTQLKVTEIERTTISKVGLKSLPLNTIAMNFEEDAPRILVRKDDELILNGETILAELPQEFPNAAWLSTTKVWLSGQGKVFGLSEDSPIAYKQLILIKNRDSKTVLVTSEGTFTQDRRRLAIPNSKIVSIGVDSSVCPERHYFLTLESDLNISTQNESDDFLTVRKVKGMLYVKDLLLDKNHVGLLYLSDTEPCLIITDATDQRLFGRNDPETNLTKTFEKSLFGQSMSFLYQEPVATDLFVQDEAYNLIYGTKGSVFQLKIDRDDRYLRLREFEPPRKIGHEPLSSLSSMNQFKFIWTTISDRRMYSVGIIKLLNPVDDCRNIRQHQLKIILIDDFCFKSIKKTFSNSIVPTVSFSTHTGCYLVFRK